MLILAVPAPAFTASFTPRAVRAVALANRSIELVIGC
jgi:hypothetical protein